MAGIGVLAPAALGPVTAPTTIRLGTLAALDGDFAPWGVYDAIPLPSMNAVIYTHGVEAMRYVYEGASYRLGILPPKAGMTATSTDVAATATLYLNSNPANNDYFAIGQSPPRLVYFKTTLDTSGTFVYDQVKRGANTAATVANLEKLVNGTGTQGSEYYLYGTTDFATASGVTITSAVSPNAVFTATTPGTGGNSYIASLAATFTDVASSLGTGNYFAGGVTGTGTAPDSGTYRYALAHFRTADKAQSGISYPEVEETQSGNVNIALAAFPAIPTRTGANYYRVFRTKVGGREYYKLVDTTSTSATDSYTDEAIDTVLNPKLDERIHRPYRAGYPEVGRYGALWRARLWTVGALKADDYTTGTASVTPGSDEVTLSTGGRVTEDMIGRTFNVAGHNVEYIIVGVTASTRGLTLNREYEGATATTTAYTIRDDRSGVREQYSEPTLVNNWPTANSIDGVTSLDSIGATGHVEMWDSLLVFTRSRLYRVTGSTGAFRVQSIGAGFGCYGGHAVQVAEGVAYWLGPDGAFRWSDPNGLPTPIGKPRDETGAGIFGSLERINGDEADMIVSNYNQTARKVRWWVPLDGSPLNNYCLRLDLQTGSFALQTASAVTAAATMPGSDGSQVTIIGDATGGIYQLDAGYSDGAYGFEPKCVVSSYTAATRTLAITGTTLPTTGDALVGIPGVIINATTGAYQRFKVASNTSGAAVLTCHLTTAPSANDYVIFGAVILDIQTARFDNEQPELLKWLEGLTLAHEVETGATEVWCGASADNDDPEAFAASGTTVDYANPTSTDGEHHYWLYTEQGRSLCVRFLAFARGYRLRLRGFSMSIRTPYVAEVEG